MSHIPLLLRMVSGPLLVEPRFGSLAARVLAKKVMGGTFSGAELHAELGIPKPEAAANRNADADGARIAVLPVRGVIAQHANSLGASTEQLRGQLRAALASRSVDALLFDFDSPGGTVNDVPELADEIREARKVKPMAAVANGLAASAGYWLAAATGDITVSPSGEVGSIGVYTIHEDWSKALEEDGIAVTAVSAGKYKLEGAPWLPLDEEAKAALQGRVDEVYGWFVKSVSIDRNDSQENVRGGYGQGRVLAAKDAVKANLADRIGTFDDALARLAGKVERSGGRGSRAWRERELQLGA